MPLGKTPAEILREYEDHYKWLEYEHSCCFKKNEELEKLRQALKDLLDHAIAEMPKKPDPSHDEVFKYGIEKGIDDCIAVLNKLKESV